MSLEQETPPKGRIAILAEGLWEDAQPFFALSLRLQEAGYKSRLYASVSHHRVAVSFGDRLDMFQVDFDVEEFLRTHRSTVTAMCSADTKQYVDAFTNALDWVSYQEVYGTVFDDIVEYKPDLLIGSAYTGHFCLSLMEKHKIPFMSVWLWPVIPSKEYPSMSGENMFGTKLRFGLNYFTYYLESSLFFSSMSDDNNPVQRLREWLGLKRLSKRILTNLMFQPLFYNCVCVTEGLFLRPSDWPEQCIVCGPMMLTMKEQVKDVAPPSDALMDFLEAGRPPVYIGWGSMVCKSVARMTELAIRSLYLSRQRGIVLCSWARLGLNRLDPMMADIQELRDFAEKNVFFGDEFAHSWLFPQCRAAVIHGGASTTHAVLSAGIPVIVTPVFLDHISFGRMVTSKGVGMSTTVLPKLQPKELGAAIDKVVCDKDMARYAAELGKRMALEDGCTNVIQRMEQFMEERVHSGEAEKEFEAKFLSQLHRANEDVLSSAGSTAVTGLEMLANTVTFVGNTILTTFTGILGFERDPEDSAWSSHVGYDLGGLINTCTVGVIDFGVRKLVTTSNSRKKD
eukprot:gnl/TRDRNA2_/TRDRNA2_81673_c0_seq1.p1 gnl/TRDRNA2_/TRDRNA2_81673_c0~~gnl/TRDRNA2_/TRDRNA2_81673_c0_seq1.p1  ORF type:complete len:567 (-),score=88.28 gnl/TRDRNA2_/TRDRNA2_81673_c0_seq1:36-1736(-)